MSYAALLPGRLIRLDQNPDLMIHAPSGDGPKHAFASFVLPKLPLSLGCWLDGLANLYTGHCQRALAALLLLDINTQIWCPPILPGQRGTADGVSFQLRQEDVANLVPSVRIAGSFQSSRASSIQEAAWLVPRFDGLHLIHDAGAVQPSKFYFLRSQGKVRLVQPETVIQDDWQLFLAQHQDRLTLA